MSDTGKYLESCLVSTRGTLSKALDLAPVSTWSLAHLSITMGSPQSSILRVCEIAMADTALVSTETRQVTGGTVAVYVNPAGAKARGFHSVTVQLQTIKGPKTGGGVIHGEPWPLWDWDDPLKDTGEQLEVVWKPEATVTHPSAAVLS
jgi:hypothetical protein